VKTKDRGQALQDITLRAAGYTEIDGTVNAEKVRFAPKAFRWQHRRHQGHEGGDEAQVDPAFVLHLLVRRQRKHEGTVLGP